MASGQSQSQSQSRSRTQPSSAPSAPSTASTATFPSASSFSSSPPAVSLLDVFVPFADEKGSNMAASSSSSVSAAKPPPLSYAERARRAGASSTSQPPARSGPNGKTRSGDESSSPASSSRNHTPNSSAALALPGSPPASSSQTSIEEQQTFPPMPKSPARPPPPNVWAARKEQMTRSSVSSQGHASASFQADINSDKTSINRVPLNGISALPAGDSSKEDRDPFMVRMPPRGHAQGRTNVSSASRTPPSLDDDENWPEMGKCGSTASTSVSGSIAEMDKKDGPSKKAEKQKWIQIPPAELQAAHDAMAAQSAANSRAQSRHRRNHQAKSRSRQQSQARSPPSSSQNQIHGQNQNYVANLNNGSSAAHKPGDASSTQSRAESTAHSRTTSVHSSPRNSMRGPRLSEEHMPVITTATDDRSSVSKKIPNGINVFEQQFPVPEPTENQSQPPAPRVKQDNSAFVDSIQSLSNPPSQSQTPYSHSPVYYPPSSVPQDFGYGPIPPNAGYNAPPPVPSPGPGGLPVQQQSYIGYPPYGIPQHFPPGQPPYPYMYHPVPFSYFPVPMPDQQLDAQQRQRQQGSSQQDAESASQYLSPVLPPASSVTRPPPPQESGPLSGYRAIAPVPVSPLLSGSSLRRSKDEVAQPGPEMVFGSVGQPDGLKSPSPVPIPALAGRGEQKKKVPTAFAVGFDGPTTIRVKRSGSVKDELENAIKVIDLTDTRSKWEFGTSSREDTDLPLDESNARDVESQGRDQPIQDRNIVHPQPAHILQYPPLGPPSAFQGGGYNMIPQMQLHLPTVPIPSQSPQNNAQPLPSHIPSLAPLPLNPGFVSPLALSSPGPGPGPQSGGPVAVPIPGTSGGDEWEVRDFGYGFGPFSGTGYMTERIRDERYDRENYRDLRNNFREPRDFNGPGGGYLPGRMRRSSTTGGYGTGYFDGGGRGSFTGRRGRGQNGFGRGFSRGGFAGRGQGNFQRHQPSLSVSTGPFQVQQGVQQQSSQVSPDISNLNGYFVSPTTATSHYLVSPYNQFDPGFAQPSQSQMQAQNSAQPQSIQHSQPPPLPLPVTTLTFPLDSTRLYLLGQLEYYFSVQNLAMDLFLRRQMDSRGWIPISLIASFNRVRQLTQDVQLVKEVLGISSLVEVRGHHVRLSNYQWANFVLPGAAESTVEGDENGGTRMATGEEMEKETEEGEEDDVVFILGSEESRPFGGTS